MRSNIVHKLSKAECGKLGVETSKIIMAEQKQNRINEYLKSPNHCRQCNSLLEYESRNKTFCNRSCAATHNNLSKSKSIIWNCLHCSSQHITAPHLVKQYCSRDCFNQAKKSFTFTKLLDGKIKDRSTIKRHFLSEYGQRCQSCQLEEWLGKPIPLEVDHIDGNAGNNDFNNIRLLCPNCHGLTDTWKGRNKGNGRAARGLPLN
jgi:hypothetical protein